MRKKTKNGFTLYEIMISISLFMFLSVMSIPVYNNYRDKAILNMECNNIINVLNFAQSQAIASKHGTVHGVKLEQTKYILFEGAWNSGGDKIEFEINDNIIVSSTGNEEIVFNRLSGDTIENLIEVKSDKGNIRNIIINKTGSISVN